MSDDLVYDLEALGEDDFYYRPATTKATIDKAAAEITRLRALVAETGALAARRAAMLEASEERERAIELRFWQIVDRDGLTGLFSDMWAALDQLVKDRAALATARMELEHAARQIDCQCGKRDLVLSELRELGELHAQNMCPRDRSCLAILAADMRAALEGKKT
jgi:hypothetical protein